jgi:hypothetical protein
MGGIPCRDARTSGEDWVMSEALYSRANIDPEGKIDLDALMSETQKHGPLRLTSEGNPYEILIAANRCVCSDEGCQEVVVTVWRRHGLFLRHWLLSKETLLDFDNLSHLRQWAIYAGLGDSRGERLLAETAYYSEFGASYLDAQGICACPACMTEIQKDVLSNKMIIRQMALDLQLRQAHLDQASKEFGDEVAELVSAAFEAGYSFGRNFSEYSVKKFIEPDAMKALVVLEGASTGGKARASAAKAGREMVLEEMTRLVESGKSAASAAAIAAKNKIGTSAEANIKIWQRYKA